MATSGRMPAPCPLAFDEGNAKGRIKNVLRYRRPALWIVVASAVAAVLAAVCLLTDPVSAQTPEGDPAPDVSASQAPDPSQAPAPSQPLAEGDSVADPWMLEVLSGERDFRMAPAGAAASDGRSLNIGQLTLAYYGAEPGGTAPEAALSKVSVIDLDGDGAREMVLWPSIDGDDSIEEVSVPGYIILRLQGDTVQGYNPSFRGFAYVKEDGAFHWGVGRARFDGGFEVEEITWCVNGLDKGVDGGFYVDGLEAAQEEFEAAIAAQSAKPDAPWYVYEGGRLWPAPLAPPPSAPTP